MFMKKMFIALKENIMLETITEELRYCKGNKKKNSAQKGRRNYEENKKRLQIVAPNRYRGLSEEEENKREYVRNKRKQAKIKRI